MRVKWVAIKVVSWSGPYDSFISKMAMWNRRIPKMGAIMPQRVYPKMDPYNGRVLKMGPYNECVLKMGPYYKCLLKTDPCNECTHKMHPQWEQSKMGPYNGCVLNIWPYCKLLLWIMGIPLKWIIISLALKCAILMVYPTSTVSNSPVNTAAFCIAYNVSLSSMLGCLKVFMQPSK